MLSLHLWVKLRGNAYYTCQQHIENSILSSMIPRKFDWSLLRTLHVLRFHLIILLSQDTLLVPLLRFLISHEGKFAWLMSALSFIGMREYALKFALSVGMVWKCVCLCVSDWGQMPAWDAGSVMYGKQTNQNSTCQAVGCFDVWCQQSLVVLWNSITCRNIKMSSDGISVQVVYILSGITRSNFTLANIVIYHSGFVVVWLCWEYQSFPFAYISLCQCGGIFP